jgi:cbb3-type cytochrome oxidase maturation protein
MSVIFILIGISIAVALTFLAGFFWAVKRGQFDDQYTPSVRILFDDELRSLPGSAKKPGKESKPSPQE